MIYGQIRTFLKTLDSILKFIDYDKNEYDVFMLIDKNNDKNYTEENLGILLNMLNPLKIKLLLYVEDCVNIFDEDLIIANYYSKTEIIAKSYNLKPIRNNFVSRLLNRRKIMVEKVIEYSKNNNIVYDKCILTRFDILMQQNNTKLIYDDKTHIMFDIFFKTCSLDEMNKIFKVIDNYFAINDFIKQNGLDAIKQKYNFKTDEELTQYLNYWICMPEENIKFFLILNNISFNQLQLASIQR